MGWTRRASRQFLNTRKLSLFSLLHSIKLSRNMAPSTINILLTSFPGLNLPATLALPLPAETSISELQERIHERLPAHKNRLILTTISNRQLPVISEEPISGLLSSPQNDFLSLRLALPMCGGKGGFGSQLRAAGGRMSSKRTSFDEDDEFMSSDEDEDEEKKEDIQEEMEEDEESEEEVEKEPTPPPAPAKGKGKGKAKAPIKAKPRGKGRVTKA